MTTPQTVESGVPVELSSTGTVARIGQGTLAGIFCSSSSSGTVTVYDGAVANTTGETVMIPTFTAVAGTYYPFKAFFQQGCNIVLGGTFTGAAMISP